MAVGIRSSSTMRSSLRSISSRRRRISERLLSEVITSQHRRKRPHPPPAGAHLVDADEWGCRGSCRRRRKSGDRLAVAPHWWTISNIRLRQRLISTLPDDVVTFTRRLFETTSINDLKIATAVVDEPCCLKHSRDHCNSRSSHPEHL
jgi:hypothetical protein